MVKVVKRFDIYLVSLDPTQGIEIKKTRPCLIISPNEMNSNIQTVIVAPMTTKGQDYPTRVPISFQGKKGQIVIDQIRTIDKSRLIQNLGEINQETKLKVISVLEEMFSF